MTKPGRLALTIYQGATLRREHVWLAGAPAEPVDLTGCSARMQVRSEVGSPDVLLELTTENGQLELVPAEGRIIQKLSATETAAITDWQRGVYDLEVVFADGTVVRLLEGSVKVKPEVTR